MLKFRFLLLPLVFSMYACNSSNDKKQQSIGVGMSMDAEKFSLTNGSFEAKAHQISFSGEHCPENVVSNSPYTLDEEDDSLMGKVFYADLSNCIPTLNSFIANGVVYQQTDEEAQNGTYYENGSDAILVRDDSDYSEDRMVNRLCQGECRYQYNLEYVYSEILHKESIAISAPIESKVVLDMDQERAPNCDLSVSFASDGNPTIKPDVIFSLENCEDGTVTGNDVSQIQWGFKNDSDDTSLTVADLHPVIDSDSTGTGAVVDSSLEIRLSSVEFEDLFNNPSNAVIFAIRNTDGISIAYYEIKLVDCIGLRGNVYYLEVGTSSLPDFSQMNYEFQIETDKLNLGDTNWQQGYPGVIEHGRTEWFGIQFTGDLYIPESGEYEFRLTSDDGAILTIDGQIVISDDSLHAPRERTGSANLSQGFRSFQMDYFQGPRTQIALKLEWKMPGDVDFDVVPAEYFRKPLH